MIEVNILYGSSCIGKSSIMNNDNNKYKYNYKYKKVEMDTSNYWEFYKEEWEEICINYLIENIINNLHKKDMIVTCGALPLPNHIIYSQLEEQYSIKFIHSLVLVKDIDNYKTYNKHIDSIMNKLIDENKWKESTPELYDEIIWNK
jgi:hypothetical protein